MKRLTIERFTEITEKIRTVGGRSKERRAEPRVGLTAEVEVMSLTPAGPRVIRGRSRDISRKGISLMLTTELKPDQVILIRLPSREAGQLVQLTCVVTYCLSSNKSLFQIGTRIENSTPVTEAAAFAAGSPSAHPQVASGDADDGQGFYPEQQRIASAILS